MAIFITSIMGDANVCKLVTDVPIPDLQSREEKRAWDIYYIQRQVC